MNEHPNFLEFAVCDTCAAETMCHEVEPNEHQCGGCYWAPINEANHQSELAALREELAERNAAIDLKHRDLIEAQNAVTGWAAKCKAAEQRNSSLECLLARVIKTGALTFDSQPDFESLEADICAALAKPTESGASE